MEWVDAEERRWDLKGLDGIEGVGGVVEGSEWMGQNCAAFDWLVVDMEEGHRYRFMSKIGEGLVK